MTRPRRSGVDSPTDAFFSELAESGRQPLLKSATGSVRFDITDNDHVEHWHVTMQKGDVTVSRKSSRADAVVRLDKATFDGMASGTVNAMAAVMRGELVVEGDLGLVMLFQRLLPSPPAQAPAAAAATSARGGAHE